MNWPFAKVKSKYLANCEYFVYINRPKLPPQAAYMARMTRAHALSAGQEPRIAPKEAILFSDIRLHIGLVLRAKNAYAFRPDLFEFGTEPDGEILEGLGNAVAFAKLRYTSTEVLPDDRHLQFMPYLAEAVAHLTNADVIFDASSEQLFHASEFRARLDERERADNSEFHLRSGWKREGETGIAFTRGLVKIGLPDLETPPSAQDHSVLLQAVLDQAAQKLWEIREVPETLAVEAFSDQFQLQLKSRKGLSTLVRVHRFHGAS